MSFSSYKREFIFGSYVYPYTLIKQERKSLSLTVTPDLQICVKCPTQADQERVDLFLRKKWLWLEKQLNYFRKFQRKMYRREYVSGESFMYLGRQYKLIVKRSTVNNVSLGKGQLIMHTMRSVRDGKYNKRLIQKWFAIKSEKVFLHRLNEVTVQFEYKKLPRLIVREMKKRWGSYLKNGTIILNPKLIHTSLDCIDYVIAHELCHAKYKSHSKAFYAHLKKKYPKWEKTKEKLEMVGSQLN